MNKAEQEHYESLYTRHISALKRQGKSKSTIDAYAHALRRVTTFFDRCPDTLNVNVPCLINYSRYDDLEIFFLSRIETHCLAHRQD